MTPDPSNNLPPGCTLRDVDPPTKTCPTCDGECLADPPISNCCGADFADPGWPDNDICSKCHEHAVRDVCGNCEGNGRVI